MGALDERIDWQRTPASGYKPRVMAEIDKRQADRNFLSPNHHRLLLVGQKSADATVADDTLRRVFSDEDAGADFGLGSELHLMARAALKANPYAEIFAIAVPAAGGTVQATTTATFSGPATGSGYGEAWIGYNKVTFEIASGDSADDMATALKNAVDANPKLPVTASAATGVTTLTAKCGGSLGNELKITVTVNAAGADVVVAAGTAGANDPDYTNTLAAVFAPGKEYEPTQIAIAHNDATNLGLLKTHCYNLADPRELRFAQGHVGFTGTISAATALASGVNNWWIQIHALEGSRSLSYEIGAAVASVCCSEEDPARPLQRLPVKGIDPPQDVADRYSGTEQETLLENGVSCLEVGPGEEVKIVRIVNTYTNESGADVQYGRDYIHAGLAAYLAKDLTDFLVKMFPRQKLTTRVLKEIHQAVAGRFRDYARAELVHYPELTDQNMIVRQSNKDSQRVDVGIPTYPVEGLRTIATQLQMLRVALSIGA